MTSAAKRRQRADVETTRNGDRASPRRSGAPTTVAPGVSASSSSRSTPWACPGGSATSFAPTTPRSCCGCSPTTWTSPSNGTSRSWPRTSSAPRSARGCLAHRRGLPRDAPRWPLWFEQDRSQPLRWVKQGVESELSITVEVEEARRDDAPRNCWAKLAWTREGRPVARALSAFTTSSAAGEARLMARQHGQGHEPRRRFLPTSATMSGRLG